VTITAMHPHRVADTKLLEHWEEIDLLRLMRQLGALGWQPLRPGRSSSACDGTSDRRQQPQTIVPAASRMSWQSAWQSTSHHQTGLRRSSLRI
jgi:hypothetical protein